MRQLHKSVASVEGVLDDTRFLRDLLSRQALGANCLDHEIALPHVRTPAVRRIVLAVGRSSSGIAFDAEHPAIRLVFLIGVPSAATAEYLRWVAQLASTLRTASLRRALLNASNEEEFRSFWNLSIERPTG